MSDFEHRMEADMCTIEERVRDSTEWLLDVADIDSTKRAHYFQAAAKHAASLTLSEILESLSCWDWSMRQYGAELLGVLVQSGSFESEHVLQAEQQRALQALYTLSTDPDPDVRMASISAIAVSNRSLFVHHLPTWLEDEAPSIVCKTLEWIGTLQLQGIRASLLHHIESDEPKIALSARIAHIALRWSAGEQESIFADLEHPNWEIRRATAWGIKKYGHFDDVRRLEPYLEDMNVDVREAVVDAILTLSRAERFRRAQDFLFDSSERVVLLALGALKRCVDTEDVASWLEVQCHRLVSRVAGEIVGWLYEQKPSAFPKVLTDFVKIRDPEALASVTQWLYMVDYPEREAVFRFVLTSPIEPIRECGLLGLRHLQTDDIVELAREGLEAFDPVFRKTALEILREHKDSSCFEHIFELALEDEDENVRKEAIEFVVCIDFSRADALIAEMCSSEDWRIREYAAEMIGLYGGPSSTSWLIELCEDTDQDVQRAALESAFKIDPNNTTHWIEGPLQSDDWGVRKAILEGIVEHSNDSLCVLDNVLYALEDEDSDVRLAALYAALHLEPSELTDVLECLREEENLSIREHIARVLFESGSTSHIPWILRYREDPDVDVRRWAWKALIRISPSEQRIQRVLELATTEDAGCVEQILNEQDSWDDWSALYTSIQTSIDTVHSDAVAAFFSLILRIEPVQNEGHAGPILVSMIEQIPHFSEPLSQASALRAVLHVAFPDKVGLYASCFESESAEVQKAALLGLIHTLGQDCEPWVQKAFSSVHRDVRLQALEFFVDWYVHQPKHLCACIEELFDDIDASIRRRTAEVLLLYVPENRIQYVQRLLKDPSETLRSYAVDACLHYELPTHMLHPLLCDISLSIALRVAQYSSILAPPDRYNWALNRVDSDEPALFQQISQWMADPAYTAKWVDIWIEVAPLVQTEQAAKNILLWLVQFKPHALLDVLGLLDSLHDLHTQKTLVEALLQYDAELPLTLLESWCSEATWASVRMRSLTLLCKRFPQRQDVWLQRALQDADECVRAYALERWMESDVLEAHHVIYILPMTRDMASCVRQAALRLLTRFEDLRVIEQLVASLDDEDFNVQELARSFLDATEDPLPALKRLRKQTSEEWSWPDVQERIWKLCIWGRRIAYEWLGRRVFILPQNYRLADEELEQLEESTRCFEVSFSPVIRGYQHGEDCVKASILLHLGHMLFNEEARGFKTMQGIARSEGLETLHSILLLERLSRSIRSVRKDWGPLLDRLAAYTFSKSERLISTEKYAEWMGVKLEEALHELQAGRGIGSLSLQKDLLYVALKERELLCFPGLLPSIALFLWCVRCGLNPSAYPYPDVRAAMQCIPNELRILSHADILAVTRRIGSILGTDDVHKEQMQAYVQKMRTQMKHVHPSSEQPLHSDFSGPSSFEEPLQKLHDWSQFPKWMRDLTHASSLESWTAPVRIQPVLSSELGAEELFSESVRGAINTQKEAHFDPLQYDVVLEFQPDAHAQLIAPLRPYIRKVRTFLEQLGRQDVDLYASRRGRRVDIAQARRLAYMNTPNLLVHTHSELQPNMYIGLLIDRSGSMAGEKLRLAQSFGALVAESARGLRGIEGHIHAFDDTTFYAMGGFQRSAVASLQAGGGNNDAGGLFRAAQWALRSPKRNCVLILISDGEPTECSVEALRQLVEHLEYQKGIRCVQVAVDALAEIVFPHYVDLSAYAFEEALGHFGQLLMRLTASWR